MPRGDRTGPMGMGPMTGRAAGFCSGYQTPGFMNPGFGRGFRRPFGRGMGAGFRGGRWMGYGGGWNYMPYGPAEAMPETEIEMLRQQSVDLEKNLELIKKRISEIEMSGSADQDSVKK